MLKEKVDFQETSSESKKDLASIFRKLFLQQKQYLNHFFDTLDHKQIEKVAEKILELKGNVFFSGVGKSGVIAQKIVVTMMSTGTRSFYLAPTDALHGDLGIVGSQDLLILMSKSGESEELLQLIPYVRNKGAFVIAVSSNPNSRLDMACDYSVYLPVLRELCPFNMVPTTSTQIQLIFGDVLSIALMQLRSFTLDDFAQNHPAGRIGRRMICKVKDLMITGESLPLCESKKQVGEVLVELSNKRCGCLLVVDADKQLLGIFTDGDLSRTLVNKADQSLKTPIASVMTKHPKVVDPKELAWKAMQLMEANQKHPITVLPVVENRKVVGLLKMHDILQSGL